MEVFYLFACSLCFVELREFWYKYFKTIKNIMKKYNEVE